VTGSNKYFSLTEAEALQHSIGEDDLISISPPGARHLRDLNFTEAIWKQLLKEGARCLLFYPGDNPCDAARRYIEAGEKAGVAKAYKCRVRRPWWRVPLVDAPDLLLTYMNHDRPRLVSNAARSHILNSVYGVRLAPGRRQIGRDLLPMACLNSVTLLGSEIVGRAYGGGLLKMEPREADKLPIPSFDRISEVEASLRNIKPQLARSLRSGKVDDAVEAVDQVILANVPKNDLKALRLGREMLFQRRRARGKSGEN
jgi:hypothetical protein